MRELRVEDALLYLDQVKVEFGDRPHIYNEFLEIMKTFKTQQIDTPGVIRRVSNLFKGNRRLVLGFNTFLPEGFQIELPTDGDGPPVAVYRAPGSNIAQVLRESAESQAHGMGGPQGAMAPQMPPAPGHPPMPPSHAAQQQASMRPPQHGHPPPPMRHPPPPPPHGRMPPQGGAEAYGQKPVPQMQHSQPPPPTMAGRPQHPSMEQRAPPAQQHAGHRPLQPPHQQGIQPPQQQQQQQQAQQQGSMPQRDGKMPAGASRPPHLAGAPHSGTMNGQGSGARRGGNGMPPPPNYTDPMAAAAQAPGQQQPPMEFDHAINYVTTIKKRFSSAPETYKKFLEILHTYQKEQRGIKEVLEEVSTLFADHPDLLKEFTYFLPDAVQAQAKAQLEAVAKESEARRRVKAQKAIMSTAQGMQEQAKDMSRTRQPEFDRNTIHVPFGAMQGRSEEQESMIIRGTHFGVVSFAPVRPSRRNELTPAQAASKKGRPTAIPELPQQPVTSETAFLQRIRDHLERRELQSERPAGSRRHTPYVEFLKCLHLFGAGIVNRDELLLLVKSLLNHGHAPKSAISSSGTLNMHITHDANELLREMEEVILGRGPYARQESSFKEKSRYGTLRVQDFDYSNCENPTPSYYTYPNDYPRSLFISNPGQTQTDSKVLKDSVVCVGPTARKRKVPSIEDYDGVRKRHNVYEEMMSRLEDERFELDMAIERNVHALRQIEPFAEEVTALRKQEEKDGQPIGRLQYRLNRYAMNSIHINAIARIYGERGDEVLQHLIRNPMVVLPIVYQRLKQKDIEWRKVKTDLAAKMEAAQAENYEGSLDVLCYFNRRGIERRAMPSRLRDDCIRAGTYCRHPEKLKDHEAAKAFAPSFALQHVDAKAVLFQPYMSVSCPFGTSHKDAFDLVTQSIRANTDLSALERERIGRIWTEFVAPWFGYPPHWLVEEARVSFSGNLSPNMVKFAPGQRVVTIFGEGTVTSFSEARYRIKLPYGTAFVGPTAILCGLPSDDAPFVRRDGVMERDESVVEQGTTPRLDQKYQLLFGTESIYLFMRLYSYLCSVLSDTRDHCARNPPPPEPSRSYFNPYRKESESTLASKLDFAKVTTSLGKVLSKDMDVREFEALGRRLSKEKVHQLVSLPKLVGRCATFLIKSAKENVLLNLYDYCNHRAVDPVVVRTHCFTVDPDASYRIQYDQMSGQLCFSYVPKGKELLTAPRDDGIKSYSDEDGVNGGDVMAEDEEDDPIEEYTDDNNNGASSNYSGPAPKRQKLK